jgi:hypothetical protein
MAITMVMQLHISVHFDSIVYLRAELDSERPIIESAWIQNKGKIKHADRNTSK